MTSFEPKQLLDRYRMQLPFARTASQDPAAIDSNFALAQRTFNNLPVDTAFLWLGGSITLVAAPPATWTDVNLDGGEFANEGFTIDDVNNLVIAKRAGWYHVDWMINYDPSAHLNSSRIHVTNANTSSSPYAIFGGTMDFFAPDQLGRERVGGGTYVPLGANDFFEIQAFQQDVAPLNVKLENLFVRWARPYYM